MSCNEKSSMTYDSLSRCSNSYNQKQEPSRPHKQKGFHIQYKADTRHHALYDPDVYLAFWGP